MKPLGALEGRPPFPLLFIRESLHAEAEELWAPSWNKEVPAEGKKSVSLLDQTFDFCFLIACPPGVWVYWGMWLLSLIPHISEKVSFILSL